MSPPAAVRAEAPRASMPLEAFNASLCCVQFTARVLHADPTRACDTQGRSRRALVREPLSVHAVRHATVPANTRPVVLELGTHRPVHIATYRCGRAVGETEGCAVRARRAC